VNGEVSESHSHPGGMILKQKTNAQRFGLLKRANLFCGLICLLTLLAQCQNETQPIEQNSGNTLIATPTGTPQIIEQEYGAWLRETNIFFVPPPIDPSLSIEEQRKQLRDIMEERSKRAQDLYEAQNYKVIYEFANPLFKDVFPDAQMFAIVTNLDSTADTASYTTMVSFNNQDYRMPLDFNQLMADAGYQLTDDTQDALSYAFIIAGMPTKMAEQPVDCEAGRNIFRKFNGVEFVYRIDCTIAYQSTGYATAFFYTLDTFFSSAILEWGPLQDNGWRADGVPIGSYWPSQ